MEIGEKILIIIAQEKSATVFCSKTGWNSADISSLKANLNRNVGYEKLASILKAYPSVSADWLMRDEGEMMLENEKASRQPTDERELLLEIISAQKKTIALLEQRILDLEKK